MTATRILVVEDDAALRTAIARQLEAAGHSVVGVESGEDALRHAETADPPFALVCVDLGLPSMSGARLCEILRAEQRTSRVPIVVISARSDVSGHALALEAGADAFLAKPFRIKALHDEIVRLLEASR